MARKQAAVEAPVEILEDSGKEGRGIDFGIVMTTSLLLIGAVVLVMLALADHYNRGPFGG